eukprot:3607024-Amphidinium_carterae.1
MQYRESGWFMALSVCPCNEQVGFFTCSQFEPNHMGASAENVKFCFQGFVENKHGQFSDRMHSSHAFRGTKLAL